MNLAEEGVALLGIKRNREYIGAPGSDTELQPGDSIVLYGKEGRLRELAGRDEGNVDAHEDAIVDHQATLEEQQGLFGSANQNGVGPD